VFLDRLRHHRLRHLKIQLVLLNCHHKNRHRHHLRVSLMFQ
jgi:hypothetical protein